MMSQEELEKEQVRLHKEAVDFQRRLDEAGMTLADYHLQQAEVMFDRFLAYFRMAIMNGADPTAVFASQLSIFASTVVDGMENRRTNPRAEEEILADWIATAGRRFPAITTGHYSSEKRWDTESDKYRYPLSKEV